MKKDNCIRNVNDTKCLFEKVSFIIHEKKSIVVPVQKLKFLGFLIDSVKMVVTLPVDKIDNIIQECKVLLKNKKLLFVRWQRLLEFWFQFSRPLNTDRYITGI